MTSDARHWRDVTPRHVIGSIEMATFVGRKYGWVVSGDCGAAKGGLARTADGGHTWTSRRFLVTACHAGAGVAVDFLDRLFGWAEQVEPAAPRASLYTTADGGLKWRLVSKDMPSLGAVAFRTKRDARLGGSLLAHSRNGGHTWRRVRLAIPPGARPAEVPGTGFFPPRFFGRRALVVGGFARGARLLVRSFATSDAGRHWIRRGGFNAPWRRGTWPFVWSSSPAPGVAWVAAFGTPVVALTADGGRSWARHTLRVRGARSIGQLVALDARALRSSRHSLTRTSSRS